MIAGGEPLMRPEILWAASKHKEMLFPIFTNGMLLQNGSVSYFKQYRNLIPVLSIEGNQHKTDERRGSGVYQSIMESMLRLRKAHRSFGLSITLTRSNFEEVTHPAWLKSHEARGCNLFFLVEYVPQTETDLSLSLTEQQKKVLQSRLGKLRKQLRSIVISLPGDEEQYGGCLAAGRGFLHVSSAGDLEPCPFAPYSDLNIAEMNLKDALHSPFLNRIRASHKMLSEANGGCTLWENREWVQLQLEDSLVSF